MKFKALWLEKPMFLKTILQAVLDSSTDSCISCYRHDIHPWAAVHFSYDEANMYMYKYV